MPRQLLNVYLSDRAQLDYKGIQEYTLENYGRDQVLKYSELLKKHFGKLAQNPDIGHQRSDIPKGNLAWPVGQHVIVYNVEKDEINVLAILHGNMNFKGQLLQ